MKFVNKLLGSSLMMMLLVSMITVTMVTMVNVTSASPATYIYAQLDNSTAGYPWINVYVNDAPHTYAWDVRVSWDPSLLEAYYKLEGTFLSQGINLTTFSSFPATWAQVNAKGEIKVGCTLSEPIPAPIEDWPNGTGMLFQLYFKVADNFGASGSSLLDVYDTTLYDHLVAGSPAPTSYPNNDTFFYNVATSHDISGRERYIEIFDPSVHVGEVANINVTVLNEGTETETGVTLNVTANETVIDTTTIASLNGSGNFENRSFTHEVSWDTTGVAPGVYTIGANASHVAGEVDTADNNFTDGTVKVIRRDFNMTDVTVVTPYAYIGYSAWVNVTVFNEAIPPSAEGFTLVMYADIDAGTIGDELNFTAHGFLEAGANGTFTIPWDMTGAVPNATYTISAYMLPFPEEVDTTDNALLTDGTVYVKMLGDVNGDGKVDAFDLFSLGKAYGSEDGEINWNQYCDFNGDGEVENFDGLDLSNNFGESV